MMVGGIALIGLTLGGLALIVWAEVHRRRTRAEARRRALTQASIEVVSLLERFRADPEGFLAERAKRYPAVTGCPMREGERQLFVVRTKRIQKTQEKSGVLVVTNWRVFFNADHIKTDWSRTFLSIGEWAADENQVRMALKNGDELVFHVDPADPERHPTILLAILDYAAGLGDEAEAHS